MDISEVWRPVIGHEANYEVSDQGRVRSRPRARTKGGLLKPWDHEDGYPMVNLRSAPKNTKATVHSLVMAAFVGPCPEGLQVRHLDGSKDNNHISNLVYGTPAEDAQDRIKHGTSGRKPVDRICEREECTQVFTVTPSSDRRFCTKSCVTKGRPKSLEHRAKIGRAVSATKKGSK